MAKRAPILYALCVALLAGLWTGCGGSTAGPTNPPPPPVPPPPTFLDLRGAGSQGGLVRIYGADSTGRFGVPVAGGFDCDGDGFSDVAVSNMQASPLGRDRAGQALLLFRDGTLNADVDTALASADKLIIAGAGPQEAASGEIWMDDVTGDGLGDLLIGRPNYREPASDRIGAGALSIVVGSSVLRDLARAGTVLDLAAPPPGVNVVTLIGAEELDRMGFWMRSGDVTGDGIADVLVGADQADEGGTQNSGEAWLLRGGAALAASVTADLADFGATPLAGHIVRIAPPAASADYHFGATVSLADLDGNGRNEVLVSASLSRVGGLLVAAGAPADSAVRNGGNPGGSLFIFWDDNFPAGATWPAGLEVSADAPPAGFTRIHGGTVAGTFTNVRFGEDLLGGEDYDGDGNIDLFVGDIKGTAGNNLVEAGVGHVFFSAATLRDRTFDMGSVPGDISLTTLLGPQAGGISSDTSAHGDLDGDGLTDLVIATPLASPFSRVQAGTAHVIWGQSGPWPALIDLNVAQRPSTDNFAITDLHGVSGEQSADDTGDTLMYSAAAADLDGDGLSDLIINEMRGNGVDPSALDVGNVLLISGAIIPKP